MERSETAFIRQEAPDDGYPKILFEGRWLSNLTSGKHDKTYPTWSYPRWARAHYNAGSGEYERVKPAAALDKEAAWAEFKKSKKLDIPLKARNWAAFTKA